MITITQRTNANIKSGFLSNYIPNPKERRTVLLFVSAATILVLSGLFIVWHFYQQLMIEDFRHYKGTFKQLGSISEYGFFAAVSIYPIFLLLKWKKAKELTWGKLQLKAVIQPLGKFVRKWHVPVALLSTGIVLLHGFLAIIRGFKLDFTNITGIISIVILMFLLLMGFKRFKRKDRQWHLRLAIGFVILFLIHVTFT